MQVKLSIERWWNDIEKRKPKYPAKNMSRCHFLRPKTHMHLPGIELGPQ